MLDTEEHRTQTTLTALFDQECEFAAIIGMSYSDYWLGEPEMLYFYAFRYKQTYDNRAQEQDTLAWLVGQYVLCAIAVNFSSAFGKRGAPKSKYPDMPMYVAEHNEQAKIKKQERDMMRSYNNFIAAAQSMGKLK